MDNDLLKSMFLKARDQYESAVHWAFIIGVLLLLFHLMIFGQFVRLGKQLAGVQAKLTPLAKVEPGVTKLKTDLDALQEQTMQALKGHLDGMFSDLKSDFEALDRAVAQVRNATVEHLLREEGASPMIQAPVQRPDMRKSFAFDADTKEKIRSARDSNELRHVLQPVIEQEILHPRFDQLNRYWHEEVLPNIRLQTEAIRKAIREHQPLYPPGQSQWEAIHASVEQMSGVVATLTFQPPTDKEWWITVSGKQATLSGIGRAVEDRLRTMINTEAVAQLRMQVTAALAQQHRLQETLQEELKRTEELFNKQQSRLAALGKPFEVLSLDINIVVSKFPLLLGILLAAITIWPAYRLRELAAMLKLMAKNDPEKVPWEWFDSRTWFSLPGRQGIAAQESPHHGGRWEYWPWLRSSFCRGLIYGGWIGLATWTLIGWGDVSPINLAIFTTGGCFAVAVALGYRWYVMRYVWDLTAH